MDDIINADLIEEIKELSKKASIKYIAVPVYNIERAKKILLALNFTDISDHRDEWSYNDTWGMSILMQRSNDVILRLCEEYIYPPAFQRVGRIAIEVEDPEELGNDIVLYANTMLPKMGNRVEKVADNSYYVLLPCIFGIPLEIIQKKSLSDGSEPTV